MRKIKVLIIDSGVNVEHPQHKSDVIKGIGYKDGEFIEAFEDTYGHGTAVYHIIQGDSVEIFNIKIYDIETGVDGEDIIQVLQYVYNNMDIDLINLSLGICACEKMAELYDICEKLYQKGTILISAFDNAGAMSYPAAFDNVIGVTTGINCSKINDIEEYEDNVINVGAYGRIQRLAWVHPDYVFLEGNSFACAHVTATLANKIANDDAQKNKILKMIDEKRNRENKNQLTCKTLFQIEKAALFPFNKEMHSLIRYRNTLEFSIEAVYDSKYSGRVGAYVNHLLKIENKQDNLIVNIEKIDWNSFDTLIIGHLDEFMQYAGIRDLKETLLKEAIEHKKNIYSFDELSKDMYEENRESIFFPTVNKEDLPPFHFGKLYRINKPVMGVFGTSSKQGKFTLQLLLRKKLQEQGIKVGQIGTEPTALLYGMDYVYPMGYNSSVHIEGFDCIVYLNHLMNELAEKENDIILVGSQSGTVSFDTGNIALFNVPQYHFLMGTQPDTIILCVNPYDDISYIERTIRFLESSVEETKVIAIVIFPMQLSSSWAGFYGTKEPLNEENEKQLKNTLNEEFQIPVYVLGKDADAEKLVQHIIQYYTSD